MIKKYSVLIGIVSAAILMLIAISLYPGGSMFNEYSVGFDWTKNFISNLFGERALDGSANPSRIWAYLAMLVLPISYAIFFFNMSKKMPDKNAVNILKYGGIVNIPFTFLTVTHLHDIMLIISTGVFGTCLVVITVFIFRTKLHLFKLLCLACLMIFYYVIYLWGISDWSLLPIMQKVNLMSSTLLILLLEYFTQKADFSPIKPRIEKIA